MKLLNRISHALKKAIFPPKCIKCGTFFDVSESAPLDYLLNNLEHFNFEKAMNQFLCADCSRDFIPNLPPFCSICGYMFISREGDNHMCMDCLIYPKFFSKARSLGLYDNSLKTMIHAFKFQRKMRLAKPLSLLLFSLFLKYWGGDDIDMIIPVPLHKKRFRMRGFNQSFLLIKYWPSFSKILEMNIPAILCIEKHVLKRIRWTQPQIGLDRRNRFDNVKGAFGLENITKILNKRILLIDDVYTTGATVNECSKILLNAGALRVDILTIAQIRY